MPNSSRPTTGPARRAFSVVLLAVGSLSLGALLLPLAEMHVPIVGKAVILSKVAVEQPLSVAPTIVFGILFIWLGARLWQRWLDALAVICLAYTAIFSLMAFAPVPGAPPPDYSVAGAYLIVGAGLAAYGAYRRKAGLDR